MPTTPPSNPLDTHKWPGNADPFAPKGWICPRCNNVYAPTHYQCDRCNGAVKITSTSDSGLGK